MPIALGWVDYKAHQLVNIEMNLNLKNQLLLWITVLLVSTLSSCRSAPTLPTPTLPTPTTTPPQPTETKPATPNTDSSMFKAGRNYSDAAGDMPVSFLDVVGFQATVDEESETLKIVMRMRDIPYTAPRGQVTNLLEYLWMVFVYLDPSEINPDKIAGDYYLGLNTAVDDLLADTSKPIPGTPVNVPVYQLFDNKSIYNSSGMTISPLNGDVNPDSDILTLTGRVPGIKSSAVFSFVTQYYDGTTDRPDNYVPPESASLSTALPEATQGSPDLPASDDPTRLIPAGAVRAFPGPEHYAGDVLTFEITNDSFGDGTVEISMSLDNQQPTKVFATSSWTGLLLPVALDTTNLNGRHTLQFKTADGNLDETYSFDVLPAEKRPANEINATWLVKETACCSFHYISETAAARDIDFISEHFQKGAEEFSTITGSRLDAKLNIYLIDRLWGNGGFGGGGELLISYTDRYYGPTIGGQGLEVLARHEFTHAADIGLKTGETGIDGIDFNYEGLAVYVAGGHFKREPLAERGAALYDLGYYVPVDQYLNISQHELAYLYPAAILTYISETYGSEKVWEFLESDDHPHDGQLGPLDAAIQAALGITVQKFDQGFQAWLEGHEPGEQLEDLRLTIELQDLRRQYQDTYCPAPKFLLAVEVLHDLARPEYLPTVMREAHAPANIAVELIIANAQQALLDGDYPEVEALDKVLAEILSTGRLDVPIAKAYLDIVLAAASTGYEVLNLDIQGDHASARVTTEPPILTDLELQIINGTWQIRQ